MKLLKTLAKRALTADAPYAVLRARALRGNPARMVRATTCAGSVRSTRAK